MGEWLISLIAMQSTVCWTGRSCLTSSALHAGSPRRRVRQQVVRARIVLSAKMQLGDAQSGARRLLPRGKESRGMDLLPLGATVDQKIEALR